MPNFHIKRAKLDGYRNIRGTEAEFYDGLNIIIGPNGCGKSNFLWFLNNRLSKRRMTLSEKNEAIISTNTRGGFTKKIQDDIDENGNMVTQIYLDDILYSEKAHYGMHLMHESTFTTLFNSDSIAEISHFSTPKDLKLSKSINQFFPNTDNKVVGRFIYCYIKPNKNDIFTLDDFNFLSSILETIAEYTPIKNIRIKPISNADDFQENDKEIIIHNLSYQFYTNEDWFDWNELSFGTRRIVWFMLNMLIPQFEDRIILIEEPELGIHPHQLHLLMQFIKEQSKTKQFIITTHSPEVLDILDENELNRIQTARYDAERKTTVIEPLSDRKIASIQRYFKEEGLLSSFWSNIGLEPKPKKQ